MAARRCTCPINSIRLFSLGIRWISFLLWAAASSMRTVVHEMRGIPFYLLKEYLLELGGTLAEEDLIEGDGWSVKIEKMEPFRLFSLSVGQSRLTMGLEERVADDFLE